MANYARIFLSGDIMQDGATGTKRLQDFLASHPDALILDENVFANISGYCSTVADEISLILEPLCLSRREMLSRINSIAQSLNIEELLDQHPLALSGGQTQLVALASLTVGEQKPLVLHSLVQGLDRSMRSRVLSLVAGWEADVLWTNPAQPFAEEEQLATEIVREECAEASDKTFFDIPWELEPINLQVTNLAISPEAQYSSGKKRLFQPRVKPKIFLKNLNLVLSPGQMLVLRGANGAGKTTLAKTIAGLIQPVDGAVLLGKKKVHDLKPAQRVATIAMAGQHPQHRAIASTLAKDLTLGPAESADKAYVLCLVDALGLRKEFETDQHPLDLSLGQQSLASIINALSTRPAVLVLDEPTVHLSLTALARLEKVLLSYRQAGGIVFCISHDPHIGIDPQTQEITIDRLIAES